MIEGTHTFVCDVHPGEIWRLNTGRSICDNPDKNHEGRCYAEWTNPPWNVETFAVWDPKRKLLVQRCEGWRDGSPEQSGAIFNAIFGEVSLHATR